jgi:hypothetical protein
LADHPEACREACRFSEHVFLQQAHALLQQAHSLPDHSAAWHSLRKKKKIETRPKLNARNKNEQNKKYV